MIFDNENLFSSDQAITATAASTNVVQVDREIGRGTPVPVAVRFTEAFDNLTSLTVAIQTATDAVFTSPVTLQSRSILLADINAKRRLDMMIPDGTLAYVRLYYTVTGSNPTAGAITAGVVVDLDNND